MTEILYYFKTTEVIQHLVLTSVLSVLKLPLISAIQS